MCENNKLTFCFCWHNISRFDAYFDDGDSALPNVVPPGVMVTANTEAFLLARHPLILQGNY